MTRKNIYGHMYSTIDMNKFPGESVLPGKTVAQQAESVDYEDIPRDIQAMREAAYKKEVKEGEFVPEFSGIRQSRIQRRGLGNYFGDAAKKTAPGLLLAGALLAVYWIFFQKKETVVEEEIIEAPAINPDEDEIIEEDDEFLI